jgi:gamma-glutamyltranspeptidase/glutathione hydrolase
MRSRCPPVLGTVMSALSTSLLLASHRRRSASLALALGLSACGGGGGADVQVTAATATGAALEPSTHQDAIATIARHASGEGSGASLSPQAPLQVIGLSKVSTRRIDNKVSETIYRVSVKNGDLAHTGIRARVLRAGSGTQIVDAEVTVGDLAVGATTVTTDTITLRHDSRYRFDPVSLNWSFHARFDPAACQAQAGAPGQQTAGARGTRVMVSSADTRASMAGCRILAAGGTAADAAVTVQAVLGVTESFGSGLAGGSLITYYSVLDGRVRVYDGLSAAPADTGGVSSMYKAVLPGDRWCKTNFTSSQSASNELLPGDSLSAWSENTDISGRAVGVPGTVKVLGLLHGTHGARPWSALWDEAITLSRHGFTMSQYMFENLWNDGRDGRPAGPIPAWVDGKAATATEPEVVRWGAPRCKYKDIRARYCDLSDTVNQHTPKQPGQMLFNEDLAVTMETVRDGGPDAFYDPNGSIVQAILTRFKADRYQLDAAGNPRLDSTGQPLDNCYSGTLARPYDPANPADTNIPARIPSLMTAADFASYRAIERTPLQANRMGATVFTAPAPSGGGMVVLYNLGIAQRKLGWSSNSSPPSVPFGSDQYLYTMTEASRLASADRREVVGDPAFSNSDERVRAALSDSYLDSRAALINGRAMTEVSSGATLPGYVGTAQSSPAPTASANTSPGDKPLRDSTSHLSIVDFQGNVLAMTTTINTHWGAHIEAGGMLLNNSQSLFSTGSAIDVNGLQGGKRPRTSMAPSIAFERPIVGTPTRVRLAWGAAGGTYIPDYVTQVFLGTLGYGLEVQRAMNADYWSGQGDLTELEITKPVVDRIPFMRATYGYSETMLAPGRLRGGSSGIAVQTVSGTTQYSGAADNRRAGGAAGR